MLSYNDTHGFGGRYNLIYMYLDEDGVTQALIAHEFGHAYGLNHAEACGSNETIMRHQVGTCANVPTSDDALAVNQIYPDP